MDLRVRPRRLRGDSKIREMVRETRISKSSLIYPIFIIDGENILEEIDSMEGQFRYSIDNLHIILDKLKSRGLYKILLFGIPGEKDEVGSGAYDENGIIQRAIGFIKENYSDMYIVTDVCLCEYTSHGHCGMLNGCSVDNDSTLELLSKTALSHVKAGADMVAPSDMMDGRVGHIRKTLDDNGFTGIPIMSYSVKYASSFYGPFREAAGSAPSFGDRKSYQMDYHNKREGIKQARLDEEMGADILMVKPALSYLDVIRDVKENTSLPLAAYSVSGEYSMIKAAAKNGYIDEMNMIGETTISIFRAGADILITYFAFEIAALIDEGRIG
ncbi:MAG: porphobilinogen synthase [Clostridium sp.]|uniref:porphobilinogen synthase n=1 Tax=Clostridium sp. TaxID=1506 RepID=UPI002FC8BDF3